jgi:hypothetical protein
MPKDSPVSGRRRTPPAAGRLPLSAVRFETDPFRVDVAPWGTRLRVALLSPSDAGVLKSPDSARTRLTARLPDTGDAGWPLDRGATHGARLLPAGGRRRSRATSSGHLLPVGFGYVGDDGLNVHAEVVPEAHADTSAPSGRRMQVEPRSSYPTASRSMWYRATRIVWATATAARFAPRRPASRRYCAAR